MSIGADLSQAYRASESYEGNIAAAFFYAYAILQIPVGWIFDHYGTARGLRVSAILVASLSPRASPCARRERVRSLAPLIMGAGAASFLYRLSKLVQEWFLPAVFHPCG